MRKNAICIGNSRYEHCQELNYCSDDVDAIAEKLRNLGFEVYVKKDADMKSLCAMRDSIDEIVSDSDVLLFYYSGHAFESSGKNYLAPINLPVGETPSYVVSQSLDLNELVNHMHHYPDLIKIFVIDACRTEIVPGSRGGISTQFAPIPIPSNTLIAFGTSSGCAAVEGTFDKHGNFTSKLLEHISLPRVPIERMFKRVRESLAEATNWNQISWEHSSLIKELQLNPGVSMSGYCYSDSAMKDSTFVSEDEKIKCIIRKLKSYDCYVQNEAISALKKLNGDEGTADDLFVIGRNVYQSAVGFGQYSSHEARNFISKFEASELSAERLSHILNGMAYEIYFDKENNVRDKFKTGYHEEVLKLLEKDDYFLSNVYISRVLMDVPMREIYVPNRKGYALRYNVELAPMEGTQELRFYTIHSVKKEDGTVLKLNFDHDSLSNVTLKVNLEYQIRKLISEAIIAPYSDVVVSLSVKDGESLDDGYVYLLPASLKLERL